MLFSVEQAFVGKGEKRAPLKTHAWEATMESREDKEVNRAFLLYAPFHC